MTAFAPLHITILNFTIIVSDAFTASVSGNGNDIRKFAATNEAGNDAPPLPTSFSGSVTAPNATDVANIVDDKPSVEFLLAQGLNTLRETNPEFTDYANFITSNYMMASDPSIQYDRHGRGRRLDYRDTLVNENDDDFSTNQDRNTVLAALGASPDVRLEGALLDYLNQPVEVPLPNGGTRTLLPANADFDFDTTSGALVKSASLNINADTVSGENSTLRSTSGTLTINTTGDIDFENVTVDGYAIDLYAGGDFEGKATTIKADTDASIEAASGITLTSLEPENTAILGLVAMHPVCIIKPPLLKLTEIYQLYPRKILYLPECKVTLAVI